MRGTGFTRALWLGAGAGALIWASAAQAQDAPGLGEAIAGGRLILEVRPRYEIVDQANLARDAGALTVRTRLGWETGAWRGFKALVEFEDVRAVGGERYNSTVNGRVQYPVIGDPEGAELNRAQVAWAPSEHFTATVGRQRILLDDQRFIGNVGWRQDEQTYDAVRADVGYGGFKASYIYLDRINRVFAEAQDWDSDSHAVNVAYAASEALRLQGFAYAFDFRQSPANSTVTWGVRASGQLAAAPFRLAYMGGYARQRDYRANPGEFELDYWTAELAASVGAYTLKASYESLEGDGTRGFATPLATLHAFNGWADVFLTTPVDGLEDFNLSLTVQPKLDLPYLSKPALTVRRHEFEAERTGADLGGEWDLQASAQITPRVSALVKFSRYKGPSPAAAPFFSRRKVWLQLGYKL